MTSVAGGWALHDGSAPSLCRHLQPRRLRRRGQRNRRDDRVEDVLHAHARSRHARDRDERDQRDEQRVSRRSCPSSSRQNEPTICASCFISFLLGVRAAQAARDARHNATAVPRWNPAAPIPLKSLCAERLSGLRAVPHMHDVTRPGTPHPRQSWCTKGPSCDSPGVQQRACGFVSTSARIVHG